MDLWRKISFLSPIQIGIFFFRQKYFSSDKSRVTGQPFFEVRKSFSSHRKNRHLYGVFSVAVQMNVICLCVNHLCLSFHIIHLRRRLSFRLGLKPKPLRKANAEAELSFSPEPKLLYEAKVHKCHVLHWDNIYGQNLGNTLFQFASGLSEEKIFHKDIHFANKTRLTGVVYAQRQLVN